MPRRAVTNFAWLPQRACLAWAFRLPTTCRLPSGRWPTPGPGIALQGRMHRSMLLAMTSLTRTSASWPLGESGCNQAAARVALAQPSCRNATQLRGLRGPLSQVSSVPPGCKPAPGTGGVPWCWQRPSAVPPLALADEFSAVHVLCCARRRDVPAHCRAAPPTAVQRGVLCADAGLCGSRAVDADAQLRHGSSCRRPKVSGSVAKRCRGQRSARCCCIARAPREAEGLRRLAGGHERRSFRAHAVEAWKDRLDSWHHLGPGDFHSRLR